MPCKAEGLVLTVDPNVIHKVDTADAHNLFSMWTVFSRCADSVEQGRRLENLSWRLWTRETFCCDTTALKSPSTISASATTLPQDIPADNSIPEVPQLSGSVESAVDDEAEDEAVEFSSGSEPLEILRPRIVRQDSCTSSRSRGQRHITSDHLEKMVVTIIQEKEPNLSPLPQVTSSIIFESEQFEPEPLIESSSHEQSRMESTAQMKTDATASSTIQSQISSDSESHPHSHSPQTTEPSGPLSTSSPRKTTTIVRGFSPSSHVSIPSLRLMNQESQSQLQLRNSPQAIPEPESKPTHKPVPPRKQAAKFDLGASSDSTASSQSPENHLPVATQQPKPGVFVVGGSSGSGNYDSPSLKSAMHSAKPSSLLTAQKKQTSFSQKVTTRTIQTLSEESDSYLDESAIDDDDEDSEWEDSIEESGKSSVDEAVTFTRVPSRGNIASHRSLLSLMMADQLGSSQPAPLGRNKAFAHHHSQSAVALQRVQSSQQVRTLGSPNDSDDHGLEMKCGGRQTALRPITEVARPIAQPAHVSAIACRQAALSPKTTRRNMLATELTQSLRRELLNERSQLKRRHTSHDIANLKQYPEKSYMVPQLQGKEEPGASSWNQFFNKDTEAGYNAQGW